MVSEAIHSAGESNRTVPENRDLKERTVDGLSGHYCSIEIGLPGGWWENRRRWECESWGFDFEVLDTFNEFGR